MSTAGARLHAARAALEAIVALSAAPELGAILQVAKLGLAASSESESDIARRERDAERKRTARGRPPDGARTSAGHPQDIQGTREGGEGGGVFSDLSQEEEITSLSLTGESEGVLRTSTRTSAGHPRAVRKTPKTNPPAAEESVEAVDAWCRGQKIPPASEVPEVLKFIRWHQKTGTSRASWLAAWQDWIARNGGEAGVQRQTGPREDPETIALRITARAQAEQADREQSGRARVANGRPQSEPTRLFGGNGT